MGTYLHLYNSESAFNAAYTGDSYLEPWVSYTDETEGQEHVDYNKSPYYGFDLVFDATNFSIDIWELPLVYASDRMKFKSLVPTIEGDGGVKVQVYNINYNTGSGNNGIWDNITAETFSVKVINAQSLSPDIADNMPVLSAGPMERQTPPQESAFPESFTFHLTIPTTDPDFFCWLHFAFIPSEKVFYFTLNMQSMK